MSESLKYRFSLSTLGDSPFGPLLIDARRHLILPRRSGGASEREMNYPISTGLRSPLAECARKEEDGTLTRKNPQESIGSPGI